MQEAKAGKMDDTSYSQGGDDHDNNSVSNLSSLDVASVDGFDVKISQPVPNRTNDNPPSIVGRRLPVELSTNNVPLPSFNMFDHRSEENNNNNTNNALSADKLPPITPRTSTQIQAALSSGLPSIDSILNGLDSRSEGQDDSLAEFLSKADLFTPGGELLNNSNLSRYRRPTSPARLKHTARLPTLTKGQATLAQRKSKYSIDGNDDIPPPGQGPGEMGTNQINKKSNQEDRNTLRVARANTSIESHHNPNPLEVLAQWKSQTRAYDNLKVPQTAGEIPNGRRRSSNNNIAFHTADALLTLKGNSPVHTSTNPHNSEVARIEFDLGLGAAEELKSKIPTSFGSPVADRHFPQCGDNNEYLGDAASVHSTAFGEVENLGFGVVTDTSAGDHQSSPQSHESLDVSNTNQHLEIGCDRFVSDQIVIPRNIGNSAHQNMATKRLGKISDEKLSTALPVKKRRPKIKSASKSRLLINASKSKTGNIELASRNKLPESSKPTSSDEKKNPSKNPKSKAAMPSPNKPNGLKVKTTPQSVLVHLPSNNRAAETTKSDLNHTETYLNDGQVHKLHCREAGDCLVIGQDETSDSEVSMSSNESDDDESGNSYLEKRMLREQRNIEKMKELGIYRCGPDSKRKAARKSNAAEPVDQNNADIPTKRQGMLFRTKYNKDLLKNRSAEPLTNKRGELEYARHGADRLYSRYPHRESQITSLLGLLGSSIRQAKYCQLQASGSIAPPPIFVTGPSGAGKTSIVRDVVNTLKWMHSKPSICENDDQLPCRFGNAYVNCATIEPASIDTIIQIAYSQLVESVRETIQHPPKHAKRKRRAVAERKKKIQRLTNAGVKEISTGIRPANSNISHHCVENNDEMEEKIIKYQENVNNPRKSQETKGKNNSDQIRRNLPRRAKGNNGDKAPSFSGSSVGSLYIGKATQQVAEKTAAHGAPVAFGRAVSKLFKGKGCAVLILDHAERLLNLSPKRTSVLERTNFLSQMLLLPKVMGLNLTVIAITTHNLIDCSRVNNIIPIQRGLGTIRDAISPIRLHFPGYRGKEIFKKILNVPEMRGLVVGGRIQTSSKRPDFEQRIYNSFLETIIQTLSSTTGDVRDIIKLGRLWPRYIEPLDPSRIENTLKSIRANIKRRSKDANKNPSQDHPHMPVTPEAVLRETLVMLDRRILPRIREQLVGGLSILNNDFHATSTKSGSSTTLQKHISNHAAPRDLPCLTKYLLLAAFICQNQNADKDRQLFTIQKSGRRTNRKKPNGDDPAALAYGSTSSEQQQLKMLRPRSFELERMLSIFVSMVGLNQGKSSASSILLPEGSSDIKILLRSLGSTLLFESLSRLRDLGLLRDATNNANVTFSDRNVAFNSINLSSIAYWCDLTRGEAENIAASLDFPLSNFLIK